MNLGLSILTYIIIAWLNFGCIYEHLLYIARPFKVFIQEEHFDFTTFITHYNYFKRTGGTGDVSWKRQKTFRHEKISLLLDNLYIFALTNMTCQALPNNQCKTAVSWIVQFFWLLKPVLRVKTGLPCQSGHANTVLFWFYLTQYEIDSVVLFSHFDDIPSFMLKNLNLKRVF